MPSPRVLLEEALTRSIIGAFYEVYHNLGFGLLEQLYLTALGRELRARGHDFVREVSIPVFYKGDSIGCQRLDMVVDGRVIIEAKSTAGLPDLAQRQLTNYLRCTHIEVGLLLHFGPKPIFHRCVVENARKMLGAASVASVASAASVTPQD